MLAVWAKTHKERTARTILDLSSCRPVVANINYVLNEKKERMCEQRKEGRIERVMNGRPTSAASNLVCTHTHTHTHTHRGLQLTAVRWYIDLSSLSWSACQNLSEYWKKESLREGRETARQSGEREAWRARAKGQKGGILTNRISSAHISSVNESGWFLSKPCSRGYTLLLVILQYVYG